MQITDEMVEKALEVYRAVGSTSVAVRMRHALEVVAADIELVAAKAENEACAGAVEKIPELDVRYHTFLRDGHSDGIQKAIRAIRARHATPTPSTPQEK